ncbi:competence/damage-inducible protein A [Candidatus Viridilinea mediisalina]|uniref:CinA-like protein n=1 Tax=Candidatus Viridilinea mediisalina TaxID=2024553 RepID=A0A2A6RGK9_9CHLR|nr:molybdopterin-binding protein [Candidatus Viridilinea mediisalina]PDW02073.1 competence/damage-inducible protein A [Candidatus Viridilinea mediisalina]
MNAEIIAIGAELLLGTTVDTNSAYVSRQLTACGLGVGRVTLVGDDPEQIAAAVREGLGRADLVICMGGLGPTLDDVTREGVALALGRPLEFHAALLEQIAARFAAMKREMPESNRRQAYVPAGARVIENPRGTAPGFIVEDEAGTVVVLPGVPYEMRYLCEHALIPYLREERGITTVILVKTLHATGLSESMIGELIADLMNQENPKVGISAKQARYELRMSVRAETYTEAEALLTATSSTLAERLGANLVGAEPLAATVVKLLAQRNLSLALHEATPVAPIFRAMTAVRGGADAIAGVVVHPLDQAADEDAAVALAHAGATNVLGRWRAELGLGAQPVSSPDPSGLTAVCVALVTPDGLVRQVTRRYDLRLPEGWDFVATLALDLMRRYLQGEQA